MAGYTSSPAISGAIRFRGGPRQVSQPQIQKVVAQQQQQQQQPQQQQQQQSDLQWIQILGYVSFVSTSATLVGYDSVTVVGTLGTGSFAPTFLSGPRPTQQGAVSFRFPPNDPKYFPELVRAMSHPHLRIGAYWIYSSDGVEIIQALIVFTDYPDMANPSFDARQITNTVLTRPG